MKLGLLWYDNDPRKSLDAKVLEAAARYREKFGADPNVCYVNPEQLQPERPPKIKLRLVGAGTVRPNHFWLELEK